MTLREVKRNHILKILKIHKGDKQATADCLGICLKSLYNYLNSYSSLEIAKILSEV